MNLREIEKEQLCYGNLLIYNTPTSIIISRNKIASRVMDSYWFTYWRLLFLKLDLKLAPSGEVRLENNPQYDKLTGELTSEISIKEWIIDNFVVCDAVLGSMLKRFSDWNIYQTETGLAASNHRKESEIFSLESKKFLKKYLHSTSVDLVIKTTLELIDDNKKDIDTFLLGNSKKKVMIFYREPQNRIVSGIVQDFFDIFNNMSDPNAYFWFTSFAKTMGPTLSPIILDKFGNSDRTIPGAYIVDKNEESAILPFIQETFTNWMAANYTFNDNHSSPYLFLINEIINCVDKKQLKLYNLDFNRVNGIKDQLDIETPIRIAYGLDPDVTIDRFHDSGIEANGIPIVSNEFWKNELSNIVLKNSKAVALIAQESIIYYKFKFNKQNFWKVKKDTVTKIPIGKL